jgi:CRISPR-associated endonuclease/helicase Cas3
MTEKYFGHTHKTLPWQTMLEHGTEVARLAAARAEFFGEQTKAKLAGELHDIGKYGDLFQRRLKGLEKGLDHWSAGAHIALFEYRQVDVALAIQGHHIGLKSGSGQGLSELHLEKVASNHPLGLRLSETDIGLLKQRLSDDGVILPIPTPNTERQKLLISAANMLETRMLFSTLVDADFLDTERTMNRGDPKFVPRPTTPELQAARALELLEAKITELNANPDIPLKTRALRRLLAYKCKKSALNPARIFTLTAPTGTGKTLAMLRFALTRAAKDKRVRRIIVVLPFLTILDQTVDIYRKLFVEFGEHYILEHHSLTGIRGEKSDDTQQQDQQTYSDKQKRLLTENWNAPIVITTSVQFLESLHANRPSACRKLHNIAGSIVLFDEVQTLPVKLAVPTLKTLSKLASDKYGCSVVFSTATQPAFDTLHTAIAKDETTSAGWQPVEIVSNHAALFANAKRVMVRWETKNVTPWTDVLDWLKVDIQALCIVNLKRHAYALAKLAQDSDLEGVYHLSTALCPQHRRDLLKRIIADLKVAKPCRVIATQCVEAGVDLDFPKVYRALAPLDAIAQAAGRCNRNDKLKNKGVLTVFVPEAERYPTKSYQQATELTRMQLETNAGSLDLDDPSTYRRYYSSLYNISSTTDEELEGFIRTQNFEKFAERYTLIENDAVNVVVPYNDTARALMQEARQDGITGDWMRRTRGYTVSAFLNPKKPQPFFLEPIKFRFGKNDGFSDTWFLCKEPNEYNFEKFYDQIFGLLPEEGGL